MNRASRIFGVGLIALAACRISSASVIQTNLFSDISQEEYPASGTSLIAVGNSSFLSAGASQTPNGGITPMHDGGTSDFSYLEGSYSVTFMLDTTSNTAGYDLTSIATISGWTSSRIAQSYSVTYTTIANPATSVELATVFYDPGAGGSAKVVLTDSSGLLATGVNSITFNISQPPQFGTVWREMEVQGSPTAVPEPAALGLLGVGAVLLLRRR